MSFAKAESCHILVIPLNTNEQNLFNTVEQIEKQCICYHIMHISYIESIFYFRSSARLFIDNYSNIKRLYTIVK